MTQIRSFVLLGFALSIVGCSTSRAAGDSNAHRAVATDSTVSAKNIVIVHGAFADGSGWESVYRILTKDGYNVTIVQNPTSSLAADVTATQNALANQNGPVVLVGHSYGGVVITQAGNDPKVKSLVYVAAYVPAAGESTGDLLAQADKSLPAPPIAPYTFGPDGHPATLIVDRGKFPEAFAQDIAPSKAQFMAASEIPIGAQVLGDKVTKAAWTDKPSYYIVSGNDHMIPPSDERKFAAKANAETIEVDGASHAVFISHPDKVAQVIEDAASGSRWVAIGARPVAQGVRHILYSDLRGSSKICGPLNQCLIGANACVQDKLLNGLKQCDIGTGNHRLIQLASPSQ